MLAKSLTYQLMFSERESFQVEAGVRELLQATQINPSVVMLNWLLLMHIWDWKT